jgi:hypothetical protein
VSDLPFVIPAPGRHQVGGAPDGADALLIARLAAIAPGGVLHVAQDDLRMARTVEMLGFMAPDLTGHLVPGLGLPAVRPRLAAPRHPGAPHRCPEPAQRHGGGDPHQAGGGDDRRLPSCSGCRPRPASRACWS